jgi:phosphatidylserine decarboxylase
VGATAVASIVNDFGNYPVGTIFSKGADMGYFQFGGSTLVLLFPKDKIILDEQIVKNSLNGYETAVKVRETIAFWK